MKEDKSKKIQGLIFVLLIVSVAAFGFFSSQKERKSLEDGLKCEGVITDIYELRSRGRYINYEFYIENVKFDGSQKVDDRVLKIGESYKVLYSKKRPKYNKMLLDR